MSISFNTCLIQSDTMILKIEDYFYHLVENKNSDIFVHNKQKIQESQQLDKSKNIERTSTLSSEQNKAVIDI